VPDTKEGGIVRVLATVIVDVDSADVELVEALAAFGEPTSIVKVVADEIRSHLEFVSYVRDVVVNAR
jgi:hypothetical protein